MLEFLLRLGCVDMVDHPHADLGLQLLGGGGSKLIPRDLKPTLNGVV